MSLPFALLGPDDLLIVTSYPSTPTEEVKAFVASIPDGLSGRVVVVNGDSWVTQVVRCGPETVPCCEHCHHDAEVMAHPAVREGVVTAIRGTDHPYYGTEGCWYAGGHESPHTEHASWADFIAEMGDADLDMNLLYRWDWQIPDPSDYEFDDEPAPTTEHLALFYMQQRKARPWSHRIVVTAADEPEIAAWLRVRAERLALVWDPFLSLREATS